MLFSIIVPVLNGAEMIRTCLDSILKQEGIECEIIVIDGASTDGTLDLLRSYGSSIKYSSDPDTGIYNAINKGIGMARGEIIGILNSDDFYEHSKVLYKILNTFQAERTEAVYADILYVNRTDTSKIVRKWRAGTFSGSAFLYGWMPPHPGFFVKKSVYEKMGTYNENLKSSADYELMLRFLYKYRISVTYFPEVVVRMRMGGISNKSLMNRLRANQQDKRSWTINGLKPYFFTTWLKPVRKISQYVLR